MDSAAVWLTSAAELNALYALQTGAPGFGHTGDIKDSRNITCKMILYMLFL